MLTTARYLQQKGYSSVPVYLCVVFNYIAYIQVSIHGGIYVVFNVKHVQFCFTEFLAESKTLHDA